MSENSVDAGSFPPRGAKARSCHIQTEASYSALQAQYDAAKALLHAAAASHDVRYAALSSRRTDLATKNGGLSASADDVLDLNVGGRRFTLRRGTLLAFERSSLAGLFCGRWDNELPRDRDGMIFLDLNAACFRKIVAFAEGGEKRSFPSLTCFDEANMMIQQLHFLGLANYVPYLHVPEPIGLLRSPQVRHLQVELAKFGATPMKGRHLVPLQNQLMLLYRESQFSSGKWLSDFHRLCDNKGPTLTVIKTVTGGLLGGYVEGSWDSPAGYQRQFSQRKAAKGFVFSYADDSGSSQTAKYKDIATMWSSSENGPCFGTTGNSCSLSTEKTGRITDNVWSTSSRRKILLRSRCTVT